MKAKWNIRRELKIGVALAGLFFLIAFSERKQGGIVCQSIMVEMENIHDNHFMDEADIMRLLTDEDQPLKGTGISRINLRDFENRLKTDKHIREAELFGDLKGNLIAHIELRRPVARIIHDNGPDAYISEEGVVMGVSDRFTSRVLLISGSFTKKLLESGDLMKSDEGMQLMAMIRFVNDHPFWRAQVAQMDVNASGEITIYPQVTGQLVEFGTAENYEAKFRKLMIFYKEILPQKGWTKYKRVNLRYEGQVIAE